MDELYTMTAVELKYAIQQKRVGVEELVKTYLERIEKHDGIDGLYTIAELDMSVIHHPKMRPILALHQKISLLVPSNGFIVTSAYIQLIHHQPSAFCRCFHCYVAFCIT